ncbi:hypothetical protein [Inediibacterium massiliense]|uniref:hypothetical protein n=1 Tax=Inediibacterium massiliense TaxID=1658111 RepID=UPI0006B41D1B|nr:hypothetical protein [Inediibacterium massiliense]
MRQKRTKEIFDEIECFDIKNEICLEDIEKIEALFENQKNIEPPEELFDNIMKNIDFEEDNDLANENNNEKVNIFQSMTELLFHIRHQISLLDKNFWLVSIFIMLLGFLLIVKEQTNYLLLLAPIVTVYSICYFYRGIYYNTNEIEAVCRYSIYEITIARTIIIIGYNILFACILAWANSMIKDTNLWSILIVNWLSPLIVTYCVSLYFFYRKGMIMSIVANISTWIGYIGMYHRFHFTGYNGLSWLNINLILIMISCIIFTLVLNNIRRIYR